MRQRAEEEAALVQQTTQPQQEVVSAGRLPRPVRNASRPVREGVVGVVGGEHEGTRRHSSRTEKGGDAGKSRGVKKPTVTVENTVVRIVLPEGFQESDWNRLKEEANQEHGEEEEDEFGDAEEADEPEEPAAGFDDEVPRYSDEERDEFGEEEDNDLEDDLADSEGDNNGEDDVSDLDDFENNQQTSLGKRMTARQLSMAKRAEKGGTLSSDQFMDEIDPLEE